MTKKVTDKNKMKILLVGTADLSGKTIGGQLEKTRIICMELKNRGIDLTFCNMFTLGKGLRMIAKFIYCYYKNEYIIVITSNRGTSVMIEMISILKKIWKRRVVFLVVGNQVEHLSTFSSRKLEAIDKYYFEVDEMRNRVSQQIKTGFLSNCKNMQKPNLEYKNGSGSKRICYYSEISYRKGFDIIVSALENLNRESKKYQLDVYGFFSETEKREMLALCDGKDYISFKGTIKREETVNILAQYLFMVFPSRHKLEGVPGAIVDAYEAGVPVICSDIAYLPYIVTDGKTGFIYHGEKELIEILNQIADDDSDILSFRKNCQIESEKYNIISAIDLLLDDLQNLKN